MNTLSKETKYTPDRKVMIHNTYLDKLEKDRKKYYKEAVMLRAYLREHQGASIMDIKKEINIPMSDLNYLLKNGYFFVILGITSESNRFVRSSSEKRKVVAKEEKEIKHKEYDLKGGLKPGVATKKEEPESQLIIDLRKKKEEAEAKAIEAAKSKESKCKEFRNSLHQDVEPIGNYGGSQLLIDLEKKKAEKKEKEPEYQLHTDLRKRYGNRLQLKESGRER